MISISKSQEIAKEARKAFDKKFDNTFKTPQDFLVDVMEETGELARAVSDIEIRKQPLRADDVKTELIDVYIDLLWLANYYNIDFEKEFISTIHKWNKRFGFDLVVK